MDTGTTPRQKTALRCRECRRRIRKPRRGVPRSDVVRCVDCADRALLRECGIDPDDARAAYEAERRRRLRCSRCDRAVGDELDGPADADVVCDTCQAAEVEQRGAPADDPRRPGVPLFAAADELEATRRAWAYGVFFFVGIAGFMSTLVGTTAVPSAVVALAVAVVGGRATWDAYLREAARSDPPVLEDDA